jgi:hypothetical protein
MLGEMAFEPLESTRGLRATIVGFTEPHGPIQAPLGLMTYSESQLMETLKNRKLQKFQNALWDQEKSCREG